jgi:glycosyltransferase involved in cell wall biosynthesis
VTGISVVIAAKDEEVHIGACLESVQWADEIVVVDDGSNDRTVEIAESLNARVIHNDSAGVFHINKNLGLQSAVGAWILSLDADEIIPEELAAEIQESVSRAGIDGFYLNRKNFFLGKWIRHCGWFPDHIIRLFRNGATEWPLEIHDTPKIADPARIAYLDACMIHNSYLTMDDFIRKFVPYSSRLGHELWENGVRIGPANFFVCFLIKPLYWFVRKYLVRRGFLDGFRGLFICTASAMTIFISHGVLWDLQRRHRQSSGS